MAHHPLTLAVGEADRLAAILLLLETTPAPTLTLIPLAVRDAARARAVIIARLPHGGREALTPNEARTLADCLDADPAYVHALDHAQQLRTAAVEAETQAGLAALIRDCGRPPQPRAPSPWRRLFQRAAP